MKLNLRTAVLLLIACCLLLPAAPVAYADETVTKLELDPDSLPDGPLYVGEGTHTLKLLATTKESPDTPINITSEATWTSTNASAVKVDKGVLTALSAGGPVTIVAKYKGFTATAEVSSVYRYEEVKLTKRGETSPLPDELEVALGETVELDLYGYEPAVKLDADKVEWSTSDSAVATVQDGKLKLVVAGETTITARFGGRTDRIDVRVVSPYKSLKLSPEDIHEMKVGGAALELTAIAEPHNGGDSVEVTDAEWTTSNATVATVERNSDGVGVVTAKGPGLAVIRAEKHGVIAAATVVVLAPFEGVQLVPEKPMHLTLQGGPAQVKLLGMDGGSDPEDLSADPDTKWEVENPLIAGIEKQEVGGKTLVYVKPRFAGTTKLTATHKGLSKSVSLTVYSTITEVKLGKEELSVSVGDKIKLPSVSGTNLMGQSENISGLVQWNSSDNAVVTMEEDEWVAKSAGTATLTAQVENKPGDVRTAALTVTVNKETVALIAEQDDVSVVIGREAALPKVTIWYSDGESEDVTDEVKWKASGANVVVVNGKVKGIQAGKSVLTGTYLDKSVKVNVQSEEEYVSFTIEPKTLNLNVGSSKSIKVVAKTAKGKQVTISSRVDWIPPEGDFISINKSTVKALDEGSGKLTATFQGKELSVNFTFTAKLTKLLLSTKSISATVGGPSTALKVTAQYNNGKSVDVTNQVTWTTSNAKVATVANGVVTPVGKGSATIKGTFAGKSFTARISVKA